MWQARPTVTLLISVPITVGLPSAASGISDQAVGVVVLPGGSAGTLHANAGNSLTLRIPLLCAPASTALAVQAISRDAALATVAATPIVIEQGERGAEITVDIGTSLSGETLKDVFVGGKQLSLKVVVGPPDGEVPFTFAAPTGVRVGPLLPQ
ncbi:MAG: hypothetical protein ACI8PT_002484 [Gammaproteobacteria bacterium]